MEISDLDSVAELEEDIVRWLSRRGLSNDEACEVWARVVLRVVEKIDLGTWSPPSHRLRPYVFVMTRNELFSFRREQQRRRAEPPLDHMIIGDERAARDLSRVVGDEWVARMLGSLTPRQRQVTELAVIEGMRLSEAAEEMSMSAATARVHLHNARQRLRELMASDEPDAVMP